ncbi:MAG: ribosomal L7Ae/L30e/S12e/Gadd45 family protein [Lachnospiraceae bacterium]|nr:ribosomal L7Ae/L30e/S12e/Gadd45 family protein [Lachnospiraceae bacterium]
MAQQQDKLLSLLGLAQRAGKLGSGGFAAEQSIKGGKACLVIVSADTSEASKKQYRDMCAYYHVPYAEYADKEGLGHAIGKEFRSVVSVNDRGFAAALQKLL